MLRPGQIVVMDNLTAHKGERIKELIEERGCELIYLPPYSPDINPIEEAFAKIKVVLREAEARSRQALIETIGRAISAVSARDARGFFEHCGYRVLWFNSFDCRCNSPPAVEKGSFGPFTPTRCHSGPQ
jgi:transposase